MSTILKALRRLEEEDGKGGAAGDASTTGADPVAASEDLRGRIIAEEAAAQALAPEPPARPGRGQIVLLAGTGLAALLVFGFGLSWFLGLDGLESSSIAEPPSQFPPSAKIASAPAVVPPPARGADPAIVAAAQPEPAASPARAPAPLLPPAPIAEAKPVVAEVAVVEDLAGEAERIPEPLASAADSPEPRTAPAPTKSVATTAIAAVVPTAATAAGVRAARSISSLPEASGAPEAVVEEEVLPVAAPPKPAPAPASPPKKAPRREIETLPRATTPDPPVAPVAPIVPEQAPEKLAVVAEPQPEPRSEPGPIPAPRRAPTQRPSLSPVSAPEPSESTAAPPRKVAESRLMQAPAVDRIDQRGLPDVVVVRTSWHPTSDRRTARIRVVASDEVLTLRQGDAIGGLVIREIMPSAVVFQAGEVEVRRKVGATQ